MYIHITSRPKPVLTKAPPRTRVAARGRLTPISRRRQPAFRARKGLISTIDTYNARRARASRARHGAERYGVHGPPPRLRLYDAERRYGLLRYAYGSPQLDPRHPEKLDRYAELAKNDKTATQSHLTESTFIFDQGFILVGSFLDILFTLVAVTIVMRVCKYLTPEPAWWMLV